MGKRIIFTPEQDARIIAGRAATPAVTWDVLSAELKIARNVVIFRARNALGLAATKLPQSVPTPTRSHWKREPLPPGAPESWELLTRGTLLEGSAFR